MPWKSAVKRRLYVNKRYARDSEFRRKVNLRSKAYYKKITSKMSKEEVRKYNKNRYDKWREKVKSKVNSGSGLKDYWKNRLRTLKDSAQKRGLKVEIDAEYLQYIYEKQFKKCYYSGQDLKIEIFPGKAFSPKKQKNHLTVDRLDNSKGYIIGNVALTTFQINTMKSNITHNEFLKICKGIANYN